jgi:CO dehydrogenase maturation factor
MRHIALAGKGSAGKSTLAPFLLETLKRQRAATGRLLVVDADPHGALTRLLGLAPRATLGQLRSHYEREFRMGANIAVSPRSDGVGETRVAFAEDVMARESLTQTDGFDFLGLGRWEMPGSNCVPNRILEHALAALAGQYDTLLMDNEAGLEHIGRFAAFPVDTLILVAQPDPLFVDVARQILDHAHEVGRQVRAVKWVFNRVLLEDRALVEADARALNFPLAAILPESAGLRALSRAGRSPLELPPTDEWRVALAGAHLTD